MNEPTKQNFLIYEDQDTGFWRIKYRNKDRTDIFEIPDKLKFPSPKACKNFLENLREAEIMFEHIQENYRMPE